MKYQSEILSAVTNKPELKGLDTGFVEKKLKEFLEFPSHIEEKKSLLKKLNTSRSFKQFSKSKEFDFLMKSLRAELRKVYGVFMSNNNIHDIKRTISGNLVDQMDIYPDDVKELLMMHQSTKERIEIYPLIYEKIFSLMSGKIRILDLACGHNPLSALPYAAKISEYIGIDIAAVENMQFMVKILNECGVKSDMKSLDLSEEKNFAELSKIKCDVCLLLKALDSIERTKRNISQELLKSIDARYIVVSFPMQTISGTKRIESKRDWFEKITPVQDKFVIGNELFYIIKKK